MKKVPRLRLPQEELNATPPTGSPNENSGVRTTGRIKKPKMVYDPSDYNVPRTNRASISGPTQTTVSPSSSERSESRASVARSERMSDDSLDTDCCAICQKRETKRGNSARTNKLVTCMHCELKIHRMCLHVDFEDFEAVRSHFECENCRTCERCDTFGWDSSKKYKDLVTCVKCAKSFHSTCHTPPVQKHQHYRKNWKCSKCESPTSQTATSKPLSNRAATPMQKKQIREIIGDESPLPQLPPPTRPNKEVKTAQEMTAKKHSPNMSQNEANSSPNTASSSNPSVASSYSPSSNSSQSNGVHVSSSDDCNVEAKKMKLSETKTEVKPSQNGDSKSDSTPNYSPLDCIDLPDVKGWSVDQVAKFFSKYFPKESHVFKDHEIDGMSLLLLKRSDVIRKLPIKLGPSLRLYSLILKIQTQSNDPTLGWNCVP